ncbi:trehalose-phosphatase [Cellulomonas sp. KRMCY2]|uniref:trehalose-phosphatase n=1 Tax=Cellulomonas sp. KRMCY2 TaxID=1304865 RepID=UPI0004A3A269|nr:trehalose-phosphatase [Cellulomonas sp. KRMCY2]
MADSPDPAADPTLDAALGALADHVRGGGTALVALDFDGALAPLGDDPAASRALPSAVRAIAALAANPGIHLALVSGRTIDDLADKAEVPDGTVLVGSHGAERGLWADGGLQRSDLVLDDASSALRARIGAELDAAVGQTSGGARVEHKPASVVLHTRTATPQEAARLTAHALAVGDRDGVDTMRGKDVVELSVLQVTKGDALADLRRDLAVGVLLYAGDDVTDERAFAALRPDDVTIRVGPGPTAARFRVPDPHGLAAALTRLAALV